MSPQTVTALVELGVFVLAMIIIYAALLAIINIFNAIRARRAEQRAEARWRESRRHL